jgi:RimJ/RimL family protein N-acetyltransferase
MRPFEADDVTVAHEWFGDSEVMRFTPTGADASIEKTAARVEKYFQHQQRHGFSKWIVTHRNDGTPIGDAGLMYLPDSEDVELGYRLRRSMWGRGLATEVAGAWLEYGFENLRLDRVLAVVHPENLDSVRIVEKIGMKMLRHDSLLGMPVAVYWAARK